MGLDALEGIKQKVNLSTMSKPALIGVAAVLVLVAVVVAGRLIGAATTPTFEISKAEGQQAVVEEPSSSSRTTLDAGSSQKLFVHVVGAVTNPGLYELEAGARVDDAIRKAGGFTDEAAQESVNLARPLNDGEQIVVVTRQDVEQGNSGATYAQSTGVGGAGTGLVNINTANEAELTTLPGIGESTARKIIADRQSNGPFDSVEDVKRVSGIGEKKYQDLRELICV